MELRVDLRKWRPSWAGSVDMEFAPVDLLTATGAYRIRARYINDKDDSATEITKEAGNDWYKAPRERCTKPCEGLQ